MKDVPVTCPNPGCGGNHYAAQCPNRKASPLASSAVTP